MTSLAATTPSIKHIQALASLGARRQYRKGTLLIQEGEPGDSIYIVIAGQLLSLIHI